MIDSLEQLPICQPLCLSVFFHFFISIPLCFFTTLLLFNLLLLSITTIFPHFNLITSNYFLTLFCSMTMMTTTTNSNTNAGLFGDTTLTKVFVGGLAWETPKEAMRDHFQKFGEILEAVIISDKLTGRSKGYGFVTFKDAESAKKACEDSAPIINGRRANCNLASLGARRGGSRSASATPPQAPQPGSNGGGPRTTTAATAPGNHVQWYYPAGTHPTPFHHQPHQPVPFYGYSPSPTYIATDISYNHKLGYVNGHYTQMYPGQAAMVGANTLMPMYPLYHYHQSHAMGMPAHIFPPSPTTAGPFAAVPPTSIMSKPTTVGPNPVCLVVE
ncbi:probable RNA-binding protein ARP1 isoform X2 [Cucumis melo]|uniref:Probable RNA-binding protein ARP1 isoform X2 n=1 Tax=Cucumis melo TaxID=3656 RepID=A0A1S3BD62_CUCME|nr:probable RNA-binding protein ARP1 isoform X2 [Cucumis melo]